MNKLDFVRRLAQKEEIIQKDAAQHVDAFLNTITEVLAEGDKVSFVGFGTFEVAERAAREGRNPQTGESMMIGAMKAPRFKAGKLLKDAVRGEQEVI